MAKEDVQTRLKLSVKDRLDKLDFVKRKDTYSQTIDTLISFYLENKGGFKEWKKKMLHY